MPTATVTSKGQITIPKAIRESLKLKAGHKVDFQLGPNGEVVLKAKHRSILDLAGMLYRPGMKAVSVEEMKASVEEAATARFVRSTRKPR